MYKNLFILIKIKKSMIQKLSHDKSDLKVKVNFKNTILVISIILKFLHWPTIFLLNLKYVAFNLLINLLPLYVNHCTKNLLESKSVVKVSGLPHTQGIQGNSVNFQVEENLRESQGILVYFSNSGKLRKVLIFSFKRKLLFREVLKFQKSQDIFLLYLE